MEREKLYQNYIDELVAYDYVEPPEEWKGSPFTDGKGAKEFYEGLAPAEWIPLGCLGEEIGFIIVIRKPIIPTCDIYVSQTYIEPAYRRRGITSNAFISLAWSEYGKEFALDVLKGNDKAKYFWESTFKKLGYKKLETKEEDIKKEEETWYFVPGKK